MKLHSDYIYHTCGSTNCKLWRMGSTFSIDLRCANCVWKAAKVKQQPLTREGQRLDDFYELTKKHEHWAHLTDQIGSYLPATPNEEGTGYYWYASCPN